MSEGNQSISGEHHRDCSTHHRQGLQDWVCLKCNNLNFSFRKKCNRCKMQTREDNQLYYQDYYYYNHYMHYHAQQPQRKELSPNKSTQHSRQSQVRSSSKSTPKPCKSQSDDLPSVSPLLKKCSRQKKRSQVGQLRKGLWNIVGQQVWTSQDFSIDVKKVQIETADDQENDWFVRSIEQMIL